MPKKKTVRYLIGWPINEDGEPDGFYGEPEGGGEPFVDFNEAVAYAHDELGGSFTIARGDEDGPHEEVAYYNGRYDPIYFTDSDLWGQYFASGSTEIFKGLPFELAPEALGTELSPYDLTHERVVVPSQTRHTSVMGLPYPIELSRLPNFSDISYKNDITDRVMFTMGDSLCVLWVMPIRVMNRSGEAADDQWRRFTLQMTPHPHNGDTLEEQLELALEQHDSGDFIEVLSTEDYRELIAFLPELPHGTGRWGSQATTARRSALRSLANEVAALGPYNGWQFTYDSDDSAEHPNQFVYSRPGGGPRVLFTPDQEFSSTSSSRQGPNTVQVEVVNAHGDPLDAGNVRPFTIRTADNLFAIVKPWLDKYQPARGEEDDAAERFRQIELGTPHGPRRREEEPDDDAAKRFKLLELDLGDLTFNPSCGCRSNPEAGASCTLEDYDIVICDEGDPALDEVNPPSHGPFRDKKALRFAQDELKRGIVSVEGRKTADRVMAELARVPVRYNGRLSAAAGRCLYMRKPDGRIYPHRIELCAIDFPGNELNNTLVHEYAHGARGLINGFTSGGHDGAWQSLMIATGHSPDAEVTDTVLQAMLMMKKRGSSLAKLDTETKNRLLASLASRVKERGIASAPSAPAPTSRPRPVPLPYLPQFRFEVGDLVSFLDDDGKRRTGEVARVRKKDLVIDDGDFEWAIAPQFVSRQVAR